MVRAAVIFLIVIVWVEVSAERGAQVAGAATLLQGSIFLIQRSVPYGWRGAPPSGFITGLSAVFFSLLLCAIGIALIIHPAIVVAVFDRPR